MLGMIRYKKRRNLNGTWHYYDFEIAVSRKCEDRGSEQEVEDIIIHEMIHYYILSNQMQDNGPHGNIFKSMMRDINARFGRHVAISHKRSKEEADSDTELRPHYVCVARLSSNQYAVAVCARTRIFELWRKMPRIPGVAEVTWYFTIDPFFNRFPRVIKPKLYSVTYDELEKHLADAGKLVKEGRVIRVE